MTGELLRVCHGITWGRCTVYKGVQKIRLVDQESNICDDQIHGCNPELFRERLKHFQLLWLLLNKLFKSSIYFKLIVFCDGRQIGRHLFAVA